MADKYLVIYDKMEAGVHYTAKDLGVAPASMTAMVRRGLVEDCGGKPKQYTKIDNSKMKTIRDFYEQYRHDVPLGDTDYFTLFKKGETLGMCCHFDGGLVKDCYDKNYGDLSDVSKVMIYSHVLDID